MHVFVFLTLFSFATLAATPVEEAFLKIYEPILKSKGLELKIAVYDESVDYYGGASLESGVFTISVGENQKVNSGILAFTLCHEMGHLLGGAPKKTTSTWASTEAQSDFYASSICLKELFKRNPVLIPAIKNKSTKSKKLCAQSFAERLDQVICQSTAAIALEFFTEVWNFIGYSGLAKPSLDVQTPASVEHTRAYPSLQCRVEIAISGSVCGAKDCAKPACF